MSINHYQNEFIPDSEPRVRQEVGDTCKHTKCGYETRLPDRISMEIVSDPRYNGVMFCCRCGGYFHVSGFVWPEDNKPIDEPIDPVSFYDPPMIT